MTGFVGITTMGMGGPIAHFVEPTTRMGLIEAVEEANSRGLPLVVIGGSPNLLVSDKPFSGVVVQDTRRLVTMPGEAVPIEDKDRTVHANAEADTNWDGFTTFTVELGFEGVEELSDIPSTVGASVVQNIGAYGQKVTTSVELVEVWNRGAKTTRNLTPVNLRFGYRYPVLRTSMYAGPGQPAGRLFPTPHHVMLPVTFALTHSAEGTVSYGQPVRALDVGVGDRAVTADIRKAVPAVRAAKGMLEGPTRHTSPNMATAKREANILTDLGRLASLSEAAGTPAGDGGLLASDYDRHGCGSSSMNPVLTANQAVALSEDTPKFDATLPGGISGTKTFAAWLVDHADYHKGYKAGADAPTSLSMQHALASTNRRGASAADIAALVRAVQ